MLLATPRRCALALLIAGLLSSGADAGGKKPAKPAEPNPNEASGTIVAVQPGRLTVTLRPQKKGEPGVEKTFDVLPSADVLLDTGKSKSVFREGTFADLKPNTAVELELSADEKIIEIRVPGSTLTGVLKVVDAAKGRLVVIVGKKAEPADERIVEVPKQAPLFVDNRPIDKLADLPADLPVAIRMSADQKVASVRVTGPTVQGTLKAVDVAKRTIVVTLLPTKKNEPGEEKSFTVPKGGKVDLEALKTDHDVIIGLSASRTEALSIVQPKKKTE